jgi:hypothetical protein
MAKTLLFGSIALTAFMVLWACGSSQYDRQVDVNSSRPQNQEAQPSIDKLKEQYRNARSDSDRLKVCLNAIDSQIIARGATVSVVNTIFDTHFGPARAGSLKKEGVLLSVQFSQPSPSPPKNAEGQRVKTGGVSYVGWYLDFDYDERGMIQNYNLSNIHKGGSTPASGKAPTAVSELQKRYQASQTETERRDVCIAAIDEGVIQTITDVSTIDAIFGSQLSSARPTKKEKIKKAEVLFAHGSNTSGQESATGFSRT